MKAFRGLLVLFTLLFLYFSGKAQTSSADAKHDPFHNQVILSHYDSTDLYQVMISDSVKFNTIVYYYTRSFSAESLDCSDCLPFDPATFDVSKYERFRKDDERYTRTYEKYGFRLTLLSVNELRYKLPIHTR